MRRVPLRISERQSPPRERSPRTDVTSAEFASNPTSGVPLTAACGTTIPSAAEDEERELEAGGLTSAKASMKQKGEDPRTGHSLCDVPQVSISDAFVPDATVDDVFQDLTTLLATQKGIRLERPAPDTLVIHHRYVPGWAMILGIVGLLFFLLGLLFFLVKTTETATVLGRDVDGGARFTATGSSSDGVNRELGSRLISPPTGIEHAGVLWTRGRSMDWQWFDPDVQAWRWYKDGTLSSDLSQVASRLKSRANKPSKKIDPELVSPPSVPEPEPQPTATAAVTEPSSEVPSADSPALAAEIERLADLHARGVLTDDEFQEAKQRVLRA